MQTNEISKEMIKWAILSKDEANTSIVVRYWAEGYTVMADQNLTLPIEPVVNSIPQGEELENLILLHAPVEYLNQELQRYKKAALVDWSYIDQLIKSPKDKFPTLD